MNIPVLARLEVRLTVTVVIGLLVFSAVAGLFVYRYSFQREIEGAAALQRQLVLTVQTQAEVAAYATNSQIAGEVLAGLLASPTILAARIASKDGFKMELGSRKNVSFGDGRIYPLYSPVDHIEPIGQLVVVQNEEQVGNSAANAAMFQVVLMLVQVLTASIILAVVLHVMLINPITRLAQAMATIQPGSAMRLKVEAGHADDEIGLLSLRANAILDAAETALDEVKAQHQELERLATHDYLTGLATMRVAEDRLHVACTAARRAHEKVALLFIDLDGFKEVNDRYGHEAGNEVLKEVAARLRNSVRAEDTVARLGGDEFVVILTGLHDGQASAQVADNIRNILSLPFEIPDHTARLGASIGIAIFPDHTSAPETMRHMADQAMYRIKKSGKGAFAFADPVAG